MKWDNTQVDSEIIMFFGSGVNSWSGGQIIAYEDNLHTIEWLTDASPNTTVNLLACKYKGCKEWRLLRESEDLSGLVNALNSEEEEWLGGYEWGWLCNGRESV